MSGVSDSILAIVDGENLNHVRRFVGRETLALWISKDPDIANRIGTGYYQDEDLEITEESAAASIAEATRRIAETLRSRVRAALRHHGKKCKRTVLLIGCTVPELMIHLESQFKDGMSWGNYPAWHIDHIRPCSSFDLSDPAQQLLCFNYKNLQPLWAGDNLSKGAKYVAP